LAEFLQWFTGLELEAWPLLGQVPGFSLASWKLPHFGIRYGDGRAGLVDYDDDGNELRRRTVPEAEVAGLPWAMCCSVSRLQGYVAETIGSKGPWATK
jgi:hypothetical protein